MPALPPSTTLPFPAASDSPETMRVLMLSVSGGLGGSERVLLDAIASLSAANPSWAFRVIAAEDGPLRAEAEAQGAEYEVLALPAAFAAVGESGESPVHTVARLAASAWPLARHAKRLGAAIDRWRPDVVHANGLKAHVLSAYAGRRQHRLVWHVHDFVGRRRVSSALLRRAAPRVHVILANSESVAADVRSIVGGRSRVVTVYNAVDTDRFAPGGFSADLDALAGLPTPPAGTVRVGLVATYARWKGHEVFLRALAALPRSLPVRGYVVGGAQYRTRASQVSREDLVGLASDLGLGDRVGFVDFQSDTAPVYRALDVVVHASTEPEPFGLVIAEAFACERAVVVSAAGGAGELGVDGTSCLVHAPGEVAQLAERIAALAVSPDLRASLGRAARATALARFSRPRFGQALAEAYR